MKTKKNPLWKQGATRDERRAIEQMDKLLAKFRKDAHEMALLRNVLANRCTVRARYLAARRREEELDGDGRRA